VAGVGETLDHRPCGSVLWQKSEKNRFDSQRNCLAENKNIRLGVDPVWPPFEFFDAARIYSGISSGYVRLLNDKLNLNMAPVPDISWNEVKHADVNAPPEPESIESKLDVLKSALDQALGAIETLKTGEEAINSESSVDLSASTSVDVGKEAIRRLREAAEMGDVTEVVSIADKIASQVNGFSPYRAKITQLADDFDFDGILELADQLEG
jgi:hypothetical protein